MLDLNSLPVDLRADVERHLEAAAAAAGGEPRTQSVRATVEAEPLARSVRATVEAERRVATSLPGVWACSEFIAVSCARDPGLLGGLVETGRLLESANIEWLHRDLQDLALAHSASAGSLSNQGTGAGAVVGDGLPGQAAAAAAPVLLADAELWGVLRRFRRRQMVRIGWRDLAGWAGLQETLRDLSDLADVCIRFAYEQAWLRLTARHGVPRGVGGARQSLLVLGMGKLGGRELNYSSDIDLVFLYPEAGITDGATNGARSLDNEEFFLRLGQRLIQALANTTGDGFVYRVDMRLRPFGDSGPLAVNFDAFEDYLQQHGRDWERYAYVKGRPITGIEHHARLYEQILRPFVYRRYLDFGVFESLRTMKDLIAREVQREDMQDNIKLGPGGIREIEFIVQAFQLIRGGNDRRLQSRELLEVLPLLTGAKLLGERAVAELRSAYEFLRRVENRLQEWNDQQTHRLPQGALEQQRLAFSLGYGAWEALRAVLQEQRDAVARHFAEIVFGPLAPTQERLPVDPILANLFDTSSDGELRQRALQSVGIDVPEPLLARIDELRDGAYYRRLDETGRRRLQQLMPALLRRVARCPEQDTAFFRVLRIIEMIGGRTVYLALLNENPLVLDRLVLLCARSQFLTDQIAAFPLLLDELIDERIFERLPDRAQLEEELALRVQSMDQEDEERQVEVLKQFQRAAVFRIAVADLTERLPLMQVSDRLTDVAEIIVDAALTFAWAQVTARSGVPYCGDAGKPLRPAGMVVIAYGKFGGIELGYASDLDLVFLHDSTGDVQRTDAERGIDNSVFFTRLGQRLVHVLTTLTRAGRLYEVDARLRPSGQKGMLVQSIGGFADYQRKDAWTWEHQALLRARAVAGVTNLRTEFEELRIDILRTAVRRDTLREEVRKMRERMRAELSRGTPAGVRGGAAGGINAGRFDLKQDAGGIADIEFLVQYWMLLWADRYPPIIIFSDNIRQLESLASGALVAQERVDFLTDTYRKYRTRMHRLSLQGEEGLIDTDEFAAERAGVTALWDEVMA